MSAEVSVVAGAACTCALEGAAVAATAASAAGWGGAAAAATAVVPVGLTGCLPAPSGAGMGNSWGSASSHRVAAVVCTRPSGCLKRVFNTLVYLSAFVPSTVQWPCRSVLHVSHAYRLGRTRVCPPGVLPAALYRCAVLHHQSQLLAGSHECACMRCPQLFFPQSNLFQLQLASISPRSWDRVRHWKLHAGRSSNIGRFPLLCRFGKRGYTHTIQPCRGGHSSHTVDRVHTCGTAKRRTCLAPAVANQPSR